MRQRLLRASRASEATVTPSLPASPGSTPGPALRGDPFLMFIRARFLGAPGPWGWLCPGEGQKG